MAIENIEIIVDVYGPWQFEKKAKKAKKKSQSISISNISSKNINNNIHS
jgi:hypothetical protein